MVGDTEIRRREAVVMAPRKRVKLNSVPPSVIPEILELSPGRIRWYSGLTCREKVSWLCNSASNILSVKSRLRILFSLSVMKSSVGPKVKLRIQRLLRGRGDHVIAGA